jgi:WD40 repeat protein
MNQQKEIDSKLVGTDQLLIIGTGKKLFGHTSEIVTLNVMPKYVSPKQSTITSINENFIISGSIDKTIRIWDINTGNCIKKLVGHTATINSVVVQNNLIISGSDDTTIRIWDVNSGECIKTLEGHEGRVCLVYVIDNLIFSTSGDKIRIWDLLTGICLKKLKIKSNKPMITNTILSLSVKNNLIICRDVDNDIKIIPITLFPGEFSMFQSIIGKYNLATHLGRDVMNYLGC